MFSLQSGHSTRMICCRRAMTLIGILSLLVAMLVLAAIPSASVALVITRSALYGVKNGTAVAVGIVCGDLIFATLGILGMTVLAETMGAFFAFFKVAGGVYLVWLGIGLLRSKEAVMVQNDGSGYATVLTSFISGFVLTLGDVKAILFYASFFPVFVDVDRMNRWDVSVIVGVTIFAVGGVKFAYALLARRIVERLQTRRSLRHGRKFAGGLMVGTGVYLVSKA